MTFSISILYWQKTVHTSLVTQCHGLVSKCHGLVTQCHGLATLCHGLVTQVCVVSQGSRTTALRWCTLPGTCCERESRPVLRCAALCLADPGSLLRLYHSCEYVCLCNSNNNFWFICLAALQLNYTCYKCLHTNLLHLKYTPNPRELSYNLMPRLGTRINF